MNNASELRPRGAILNVPGSSNRVSLPLPVPEDFLKCEEKTLIWAGHLDCGDRAILKCIAQGTDSRCAKTSGFRVERIDALVYLSRLECLP
jgi:hypothetical protein